MIAAFGAHRASQLAHKLVSGSGRLDRYTWWVDLYKFDDVTVSVGRGIIKGGQVVSARPQMVRLLICLVRHRPTAVNVAILRKEVWEDASAVAPHTIEQAVSRLRLEVLRDRAGKYIQRAGRMQWAFVFGEV